MQKAFKVVSYRDSKYYSIIASQIQNKYIQSVEYKVGEFVVCQEGRPLMVFNESLNAISFIRTLQKGFKQHIKIFECQIENIVQHAIFSDNIYSEFALSRMIERVKKDGIIFAYHNYFIDSPPYGTIFAERVKLLKEVYDNTF